MVYFKVVIRPNDPISADTQTSRQTNNMALFCTITSNSQDSHTIRLVRYYKAGLPFIRYLFRCLPVVSFYRPPSGYLWQKKITRRQTPSDAEMLLQFVRKKHLVYAGRSMWLTKLLAPPPKKTSRKGSCSSLFVPGQLIAGLQSSNKPLDTGCQVSAFRVPQGCIHHKTFTALQTCDALLLT